MSKEQIWQAYKKVGWITFVIDPDSTGRLLTFGEDLENLNKVWEGKRKGSVPPSEVLNAISEAVVLMPVQMVDMYGNAMEVQRTVAKTAGRRRYEVLVGNVVVNVVSSDSPVTIRRSRE